MQRMVVYVVDYEMILDVLVVDCDMSDDNYGVMISLTYLGLVVSDHL